MLKRSEKKTGTEGQIKCFSLFIYDSLLNARSSVTPIHANFRLFFLSLLSHLTKNEPEKLPSSAQIAHTTVSSAGGKAKTNHQIAVAQVFKKLRVQYWSRLFL